MIKSHDDIKINLSSLLVLSLQSVCHEISIAHEDFVAMSAGISGFYRGIRLRINITLWVRMIMKTVEAVGIIVDQ